MILKKQWKISLLLFMVVTIFAGGVHVLPPETYGTRAEAKTLKANSASEMCVSDGVMYYSLGANGLYSYDLEKKKVRRILDTSGTEGIYDISAKGKYLYAVWNRSADYEVHVDYIYRISKDGKQVKKLAKGDGPVISGNLIYYNILKSSDSDAEEFVGYGSMKLDGSGKKKIKKPKFFWNASSPSGTLDGRIYGNRASGNFSYYLKSKKLMSRNKKTKKVAEVFSWKDVFTLEGFCVHKQHVILCISETDEDMLEDTYRYYYVKNNGKNLKMLGEYEVD